MELGSMYKPKHKHWVGKIELQIAFQTPTLVIEKQKSISQT
jgi:hypothetical protein